MDAERRRYMTTSTARVMGPITTAITATLENAYLNDCSP
jgi:hypothetical protein